MAARIEHLVTSGQFSLDGGTWEVDDNVRLVGTDHEVLVVNAAHDAEVSVLRRGQHGKPLGQSQIAVMSFARQHARCIFHRHPRSVQVMDAVAYLGP
jgi:hypothetical protein